MSTVYCSNLEDGDPGLGVHNISDDKLGVIKRLVADRHPRLCHHLFTREDDYTRV